MTRELTIDELRTIFLNAGRMGYTSFYGYEETDVSFTYISQKFQHWTISDNEEEIIQCWTEEEWKKEEQYQRPVDLTFFKEAPICRTLLTNL